MLVFLVLSNERIKRKKEENQHKLVHLNEMAIDVSRWSVGCTPSILLHTCVYVGLSLVGSATVVRVTITLRKPRRCMLRASDWSSLPGDQSGRGCIRKCCFSLYPWCNLNAVVSCVELTWGAAS